MKSNMIKHHILPLLAGLGIISPATGATFYWDSTSPFSAAGFGNAQGTWAQNSTSGGGRWVTSSTGSIAGNASQGHNVNDIYNFGTAVDGLGAGTITVNGTVEMGNTNYGSASGQIILNGGTINYGAARTITVNNATNTINSIVAGAGTSLTVAGAGTLVFGGANTYSGLTIINDGTLALSTAGSINNTSGVVMDDGTFDVSALAGGYSVTNLSGSGTVLGNITVTTQLSIGASPGTMDFQSLTLAPASSFAYDVTGGGTAADLANVTGTLAIGSGTTLDLVQLGTFTVGDKFTLFAYDTGNLAGNFDGLEDGDSFTAGGGIWVIDYDDNIAGLNGGTGTSFVTITAIPEPGTALLGAFGMLMLLRRRR